MYPRTPKSQLIRGPLPTFLLAVLAASLPAHAGVELWTSLGPPDTHVTTLEIDPSRPSTLFAGTESSGLFRSHDRGTSWEHLGGGLPQDDKVYDVLVDPRRSATVYASLAGPGIYKSTDGGDTWVWSSSGFNTGHVPAIAIHPEDSKILYAGTFFGGVFKSTDGAGGWQTMNGGLTTPTFVHTIAVDPAAPDTLYIGATNSQSCTGAGPCGVFKSTDGAEHWELASQGLPQNPQVITLVLDPTSPSMIYAGVQGLSGGLFKSIDAGASWSPAHSGLPDASTVTALVLDPHDPSTLYAAASIAGNPLSGVFKSDDDAGTWVRRSPGLPGELVNPLVIDPSDPALLYVGTDGQGVFDLEEVPPGPWLSDLALAGFEAKIRLSPSSGTLLPGELESDCIVETLCVSGALPGRPEIFLKVIGPRPNGFLWSQLNRFTPSQVDIWLRQQGTGATNFYRLDPVGPSETNVSGLQDRTAFSPQGQAISPILSTIGAKGSLLAPLAILVAPRNGEAPPPPDGPWLTTEALPGFRVKAQIKAGAGTIAGARFRIALPKPSASRALSPPAPRSSSSSSVLGLMASSGPR